MSSIDWLALAPLLVLSGGAVFMMILVSITRNLGSAWLVALATTLGAALACIPAAEAISGNVTPLLKADGYALFFTALFSVSGFVSAIVARDYLSSRPGENEEFYLLLVLSTLGAGVLAYANHFAALMLGMELLTVSLYVLIAYPDRNVLPLEAAIKYLILSAVASAIFLFGSGLLYAALGTLEYGAIGTALTEPTVADSQILLAAGIMIIAGLGFKLSLVPFHMWTPDVYEGAPAPISGFLAAVSKGAIFAALLRWWNGSSLYDVHGLLLAISVIAVLSMLAGNLLALRQQNVKRLLAYSSIAHMGYLLIVLVAGAQGQAGSLALEAAAFYLVAYIITTLAAFTLLGLLSRNSGDSEIDQVADLSGLFWQQPGLSLLFTVALLSLAGIPLTAGFIGKFYLFATGVAGAMWVLLAALVIGSGIAIYYYLRMVFCMTQQADAPDRGEGGKASWPARMTCTGLVLAMLWFGIVPEPLLALLRTIL